MEMNDKVFETTKGLPEFSQFKPENLPRNIDYLIDFNKEKVKELLSREGTFTWDNFIQPLDELDDTLSRIWSPASHMNSVVNSDELREAYNHCLPLLTEYGTELAQNGELYSAYKSIRDSGDFEKLTPGQKASIEHALRDFHLAGVDLPEEKKQRYREISQRLSTLTTRFEENLLDATNAWEKHIEDVSALTGLPQSALDMAKQTAEAAEKSGYMLTLQFPSYFSVITYAEDRELRREVYHAYSTRASDQGADPNWDNSAIMEEILALRHEQSQLLGFANYAERSLAKKMAESPERVIDFLTDMADRSKPAALDEFEELKSFAKDELGLDELMAWDVSYASEKLKTKRYEISQEDLKPYFPVDRVVNGLFAIVEKLFAVTFKEKQGVDTWHPDVQFYEIFDSQGQLKGQFYFDLYARPKKRGGAWMDVCITRMKKQGELQSPVAYMTCNSTPPVGDKPALFTHDEVITLFHEFGHGLHHMLTEIDYPSVSGIAGVEWDAVELPSQFMENYCWEKEALDLFAIHHETGETIPEHMFEKLIASKNFQAAMQTLRQVEFALFDMRLHKDFDPKMGGRIQETLDDVREKVAVVKPPSFNRFQHGFSHIFAGGYAAGYYSYKWAEVLSADAFARFEEEGVFNAETGAQFVASILSRGGSRTAFENFVEFRGREPEIDALLRHNGLLAA